ncbi:MAG: hypothetical protein MUE53_01420 [Chitinophagales bacterium]|jgi:3-phosphoshikimate 1-carboxyvinyltransferase|nr:hypothetical protein [Chitinophagales bacterium]
MNIRFKAPAEQVMISDSFSSKSYTQRALMLSLLAEGTTKILQIGQSADEIAAQKIVHHFAQRFKRFNGNSLEITYANKQSTYLFDTTQLHIGESGFLARSLPFFLALGYENFELIAEKTLKNRDMSDFGKFLEDFGFLCHFEADKFPLTIYPKPIDFRSFHQKTISSYASSQYISGLLMMLAMKTDVSLALKIESVSYPYIEMTLHMISEFGGQMETKDEVLWIHPPKLKSERTVVIENDWSSASFWIVLSVVLGEGSLTGLNPNSLQSDKAILNLLDQISVKYLWDETKLHIIRQGRIRGFEVSLKHNPDLFPILVILALFADEPSTFTEIYRLKNKESDRLQAMCKLMDVLGQDLYLLKSETLVITPKESYRISRPIDTLNDHRIAMSAMILCAKLGHGEVQGIECIEKSYPEFIAHLSLTKTQFDLC